jgi:hypothetical protein
MQVGDRHRQVIGVGICAIAIGVAVAVPRGGASSPDPALTWISSVDAGGSLAATVTWPVGSAERSDICVVVFGDDGSVVDDADVRLTPIQGRKAAGRWEADGLAPGRYTVHVSECVTPSADASVEPQFLGGGDEAGAASWVEVAKGERADVGTIALHSSGQETWRTKGS